MSPHAHARVLRVDPTRALALPGVKVVLTPDDVPGRHKGQLFMDRPILTRKARFVGDIVAAVAAESQALARKAAVLVDVEYEPLPALFDLDTAFSTDPPVIIHDEIEKYEVAQTGHPLFEKDSPYHIGRDTERPNTFGTSRAEVGDVERGFAEADLIIENEFTTGMCYQAPLEPHVAIGDVNPLTGDVTVYSACQSPYRAKMELCYLFNLPPSKVVFLNPPVGGGFGNKSYLTIEDLVVALSLKAKRPVKLVLPRHDDFTSTVCRNGSKVQIKDGVTKDGRILARDILVLFNAGAYNDATYKYIASSMYPAASSYKIPNFRVTCYGVYTNTLVNGAFRGFGMTEVIWATERQIDLIAAKLRIDPVEVRRKNVIRDNVNSLNEEMGEVKLVECLNHVVEAVGGGKRPREPPRGVLRRGVGIAVATKGVNMHKTSLTLKIHPDGVLELRSGSQEIGTGSMSGLAQIVAEEFKVPFDKVELVFGDTRLTPYDEGCTGSRAIAVNGSATVEVCRELKARIFAVAANILQEPAEALTYVNGRIFPRQRPERAFDVSELFYNTQYGVGTLAKESGELIASITYDLKSKVKGRRIYHQSYTVGAQAAEVEVNVETGRVRVLRTVTAVDVGTPLNPLNVEAQVEGGVAQGISTTLYEELRLDDQGRLLNPSFMDYRLLTAEEQPTQMETILVKSKNNFGPYGAKSVGEFPILPTGPAIASAIYDAIGIQFTHLPITQETVWKATQRLRQVELVAGAK